MSNRLAENSNRKQLHFDDFEEYQEPTTQPNNEENQDDRYKFCVIFILNKDCHLKNFL